jgi:hypothetical protein
MLRAVTQLRIRAGFGAMCRIAGMAQAFGKTRAKIS